MRPRTVPCRTGPGYSTAPARCRGSADVGSEDGRMACGTSSVTRRGLWPGRVTLPSDRSRQRVTLVLLGRYPRVTLRVTLISIMYLGAP